MNHIILMALSLDLNLLIRRLRTSAVSLLALAVLIGSLSLAAKPALAFSSCATVVPSSIAVFATKIDAAAKDIEGKVESAYGDVKGDVSHQLKGQAKQSQASGMNAIEDAKDAASSVGKKISGPAGRK